MLVLSIEEQVHRNSLLHTELPGENSQVDVGWNARGDPANIIQLLKALELFLESTDEPRRISDLAKRYSDPFSKAWQDGECLLPLAMMSSRAGIIVCFLNHTKSCVFHFFSFRTWHL